MWDGESRYIGRQTSLYLYGIDIYSPDNYLVYRNDSVYPIEGGAYHQWVLFPLVIWALTQGLMSL